MWYLNDKPVGNSVILGDRRIINPTTEQYLAAGCVDRPLITPEQEAALVQDALEKQEAFAAACRSFRQVCAQIRVAADLESFTGGFDEMVAFQQSPAYSTILGLQLGLAWAAANELCKYTGAKLGYGQPEWWYHCWEAVEEAEPSTSNEPETAVEDE